MTFIWAKYSKLQNRGEQCIWLNFNLCSGPFYHGSILICYEHRPACILTAGTAQTQSIGFQPNSYTHNHKRVFSHLLSCRFSSKFDLNSTSRGHQNPYHRHASLTMVYYLNCKTTLFKVLTILLFNSKITNFNLFVDSLDTLISFWSITSRIYCRVNKTG